MKERIKEYLNISYIPIDRHFSILDKEIEKKTKCKISGSGFCFVDGRRDIDLFPPKERILQVDNILRRFSNKNKKLKLIINWLEK